MTQGPFDAVAASITKFLTEDCNVSKQEKFQKHQEHLPETAITPDTTKTNQNIGQSNVENKGQNLRISMSIDLGEISDSKLGTAVVKEIIDFVSSPVEPISSMGSQVSAPKASNSTQNQPEANSFGTGRLDTTNVPNEQRKGYLSSGVKLIKGVGSTVVNQVGSILPSTKPTLPMTKPSEHYLRVVTIKSICALSCGSAIDAGASPLVPLRYGPFQSSVCPPRQAINSDGNLGVLGCAVRASGSYVGGTYGLKLLASKSIPYLMSYGATVVKGVGSFMPWWIGPVQAFTTTTVVSTLPTSAVIGGVAGTVYYVNKYHKAEVVNSYRYCNSVCRKILFLKANQ